MSYFPFFVDISDRECLIVGGGKIAYRKACAVLKYGAKVLVVAPEICEEFELLKKEYTGAVKTWQREFTDSDTDNRFFVIAATDDEKINKKVSEICFKKNILVNTVDRKEYCNFYFPSIVKKGDIVVGVSSGGKSPVLARELRKKIENAIPDNLEKINVWLGKLRPYIKENIPEEEKRKEVFEKLGAKSSKLPAHFTIKAPFEADDISDLDKVLQDFAQKGDTLTEEELARVLEEL